MATIDELKNRYFVQAGDANLPTEPVPQTFQDSKITPLIDCSAYNNELEAALNLVGTGPDEASNARDFILIANWWLGLSGGTYVPATTEPSAFGPGVVNTSEYRLDGPGGVKILTDILKQKARKGVDVRVLGWVSFAVMDSAIAQGSGAASIARVNALTMQSIKDLRTEPKIASKAMLNVIAHTAGAVHSKVAIIGTNHEAIGFTGGLDLEEGRWAHPLHFDNEIWHDVVAKIEGPAVQALYDWFQKMWYENISRAVRRFKFENEDMPSFLPGTPVLAARALPTVPKGNHHVQSLRTVAKFNYKWDNCLPENDPISFAQQGLFEFRAAMHKALTHAQTYIYMEDQSFWSKEILGWVNEAIKANAGLRVILLTSGAADPNDPQFPDAILCNSINHGLLEGLTSSQRDQVRMYKRLGDYVRSRGVHGSIDITAVTNDGASSRATTNIPAPEDLPANALARERYQIRLGVNEFKVVGNEAATIGALIVFVVENLPGPIAPTPGTYDLYEQRGITIHSKTTLIDDQWAIIGSGNIMRRSLYTDLEHCISMLDGDEPQLLVKNYRKALWADHFRYGNPDDFDNIQGGLHSWESTWGSDTGAPTRPSLLEPITLPITPDVPLDGSVKDKYDKYQDTDSREAWGGLCP